MSFPARRGVYINKALATDVLIGILFTLFIRLVKVRAFLVLNYATLTRASIWISFALDL